MRPNDMIPGTNKKYMRRLAFNLVTTKDKQCKSIFGM